MRLRDVLIDQFIASFTTPPKHLTFDLDAVDDPAHGEQQLVLFHGYFDQYQYFPSFITCALHDQVVVVSLRPGSMHAALGADDDLEYLVRRWREAWPGVHSHVRGDAGYGVPWMYAVCERREHRLHLRHRRQQRPQNTQRSLARTGSGQLRNHAATATLVRRFLVSSRYAGTWPMARWVIVKAEANTQGTNRRFIVSNRSGARIVPEAAYDDYADRGEAENRNKELKCDLRIDRRERSSLHGQFLPPLSARRYLHVAICTSPICTSPLTTCWCVHVGLTPRRSPVPPVPFTTPLPTDTDPLATLALPAEALAGTARRRYFSRRRQADPLGEGQPCTWRSLLFKVAAEVVVSSRRVLIRLSASWPYLDWYRRLCEFLMPPRVVSSG